MPVPSLAGLCRRVIWDNIDELSYVSTLPYFKVRDILKQVKTASQLAVIEEYSPQIVGEDAELWEAFCRRDFRVPMKRDPHEPENPRAWRGVYEFYADLERKREAEALEKLGATYADLNKMKMENKTAIGDPRKLPKAPSGGGFGKNRGKGPGPGSATLTFGGGARTTNAVRKAKKEAMEAAARKKLSVPKTMRPTAHLAKVTKAPESMKADFRIRAQPKFIPPPTAPAVAKRPHEEDDERAQMEARLLAAKRPKVMPKSMSDEELRLGSSKSGQVTKLAVKPGSELPRSASPNKPRSLFSRPQSASVAQSKLTVKTVGKPGANAAPEKTAGALKMKAGHPGSAATSKPSSSAAKSASPPKQQPSRPGVLKSSAVARHGNDLSRAARVASPVCEDYKPSRIAPPKRVSRSPSVATDMFSSPEPEAPGPSGRRSSLKSNSSRSASPAAPAQARQRANTPPTTATTHHEPKSGSPPKRKPDEAPAATSGGAAAHPPAKKKKVDIFMRRKR
ncbi:rna polymerase ii transcription factor siii subunit a [Diaporthe eres]|uniref:RNA polymerase II transcription factor SIII subunit A n=1 Tax=Diaporthe vaccinii TaxID=105482 RepID=A0ABR4EQJ7_9PEZI|nr:rna polymerase ii transcription factor siii subunit a [Diaporthe eres]